MKKTGLLFSSVLLTFFFQVQNHGFAQCSVDAGADKTICSGQTTTLIAVPSGGTLPFTYLWSNTSTNASITVGTAGTYTVTVTDAAITPCTASDQVVVNVNPLPAPVVSGLQCVCINSSGVAYSTPDNLGSGYVWTVAGGTISTGQGSHQITVNWGASAGAGPVKVIETSTAGCVNSSTLNVTINNYPAAIATVVNNNACSGTAVNFQAPSGTGYTYLWNFGDPTSGTNNTSTLQNPSHIFRTYGCSTTNYNVTVTLTNSCGCTTTSAMQVVTIKQQPNPQLQDQDPNTPFSNCDNNPTPTNPGFQLNLNNITTNTSCITSYTINWGDGGGPVSYPPGFTTASHLYTQLGAFNLVFTATNGTTGCSNSNTFVVVNQSNPAVGISAPGTTTGCLPVTWSFTILGAGQNSPGTTYRMEFGDGTTIFKTNEQLLLDSIIPHTYTTSSCGQGLAGNQFIVKVTAVNGCDSTYALVSNVKVYQPPTAGFTSNPANIGCISTPVCFINTTTNGYGFNCSPTTTYSWNFGDPSSGSNTSTLVNPCHTYANPGNYTITLTASNPPCPTGTTYTKTICIDPSPNSSFTVNNDIGCKPLNVSATNTSTTLNTCGDLVYTWSVVFNGAGTCTPSAGTWSFVAGSDQHSQHASFIFTDQGTYTITLAVQNSCSTVTSTKTVTVKTVPKVTVAPITSICAQGTVYPTGSYELCYGNVPAFSWLFPGGNPTGSTLLNPGAVTYSTPNTYTITLNATNECGTGTSSANLVVKPVPVATATPANQTICTGASSQAIVLTSTLTSTTYSWSTVSTSGITGAAASGTANPIPSWILTNPGSAAGTITITITPATNGCTGVPVTHVITVNPLPLIFNLTGGGEYCAGGMGKPVGLSGSQTGIIYQCFKDGVADGTPVVGTGNAISFGNKTAAGIYTAKATNSTSTCQKDMSGNAIVVINPLPYASAGSDKSIPFGTSTSLAGIAGGGTSPLAYSWAPLAGIASGGTTLAPQTTNLYTNTTFSLMVTDSKACTASDNVIVFTNGGPLSVECTAMPGVICNNGGAVQLNAAATGGSGTYTYSWVSSPAGSPQWSSVLPNPVVIPTVTTTYTVTVNDGFNMASNQVTVTVYPLPFAFTVSGGGEFCSGGNGVSIYLNGSEINVSYQLLKDGMPLAPQLVGTGSVISFGVYSTSGTYTAIGTNMVTNCQRVMSGSATVTVKPVPVITNSPLSKTICSGSNTSISLFSTVPGTTFQWTSSVISGSITGNSPSGISTGFIGDILVNTGMTSGIVSYTITPVANGCTGIPVNFMVTVQPLPLISTSPASQTICSGFTSQPVIVTSTLPGTTCSWTTTSTPGVTGAPLNGTGNTIPGWVLYNSTPSIGTVTINIVPSFQGCTGTSMNYQVNVNPPPVPGISGPGTVCIGAAASVYSTEPGMTNYNWAVSAGGTITAGANTNQATISWNVTGPQSVSVSYVNSNGCPAATPTTLPIVVNPLPVPVIAGPTSVCAGTTALYTTQPGMTGYQWSISPGGSIVSGGSSASSSMSVLWNEAGPQDVILSYSSGGCQAATPTLLPVNIIARPLPVITGTNVVCSGTSASYHTDEGKSSYVWAVSSGGTIVAGAGTSTIMVLWNTPGQQQVSVNYVSGEGCNAFNPATYAVTVTGIPAAAGTISGLPSVCVNATAVPYSVSPIQNADTYNWTLPLGMTLASGAGTNSIKVNFPGYITTGNLRVSGVNNCFSGPSSPNFQVKTNALLTGQVVLNNMIIGNEQTECLAVQNIILGGEAPFMILAGGQVRLIASDNILFLAGTSVNAGGYLSATITGQCIPCNGSKTPEPTGSYTATANSDISDLPGENQLFRIWPNPTTGIFTIEFKHPEIGKTVTIQIFDVMGKMIQDQKVEAFSKRDFSVAEFPAGIYHLRLIVDNHTEVIRIIKAR